MDFVKKVWRYMTTPEMLLYILFGIGTTLINILVFHFSIDLLHWNWKVANIVAWILSVAFAFITNKLLVFRSKSMAATVLWRELVEFVGARLLSLGVDYACLWLLMDVCGWGDLWAKILDNVLVIIINYALSKLIIFKKK